MNESAAIANLLAGRRAAFQDLYRLYVRPIFAFLYVRTRHRETSEDLTSAVFLKAFDRLDQFHGGSFRAWIYQIARTTLIDYQRGQRPASELVEVSAPPDAEAKIDRAMNLERIRSAIATLTDEQRDVILLRVWDELPYADIAQLLGRSEAACKTSFSRSVQQLKSLLIRSLVLIILSLTIP